MAFLDWLRRPTRTLDDPVFGLLKYGRGSWSGHVLFPPTGEQVMVVLDSDGSAPSEEHRALFSELVARYESLRPAIADALFALWKPHLDDWNGDLPPVATTADGMSRYTMLDYVDLIPPSVITLGFGFVEEVGWADAMFSLKVRSWTVSPESLDD